jgi:transcriptional repressor NrdR
LDKILQEVIDDILSLNQNIIDSPKIGELVSNKLKKYDKVAYICFLAVYGNFETIQDFNRLLQQVK